MDAQKIYSLTLFIGKFNLVNIIAVGMNHSTAQPCIQISFRNACDQFYYISNIRLTQFVLFSPLRFFNKLFICWVTCWVSIQPCYLFQCLPKFRIVHLHTIIKVNLYLFCRQRIKDITFIFIQFIQHLFNFFNLF